MFKFMQRGDNMFLEACRDAEKRDEMIHGLERSRFWAGLVFLVTLVLLGVAWFLIIMGRPGGALPGLDRGMAWLFFMFVVAGFQQTQATISLRLLRSHWLGRDQVAESHAEHPSE